MQNESCEWFNDKSDLSKFPLKFETFLEEIDDFESSMKEASLAMFALLDKDKY